MRTRIWLTTIALALAAAPAASAAPLDLGPGTGPSVVVDPAGTAHLAWSVSGGEMYCRIPRGAAACDVSQFLPLPNLFGHVAITRRAADGALFIVADTRELSLPPDQSGKTWLRSSSDGGVTWQGPGQAATGTFGHTATLPSNDGQAFFTLTPSSAGLLFQVAPVAGVEARVLNLGVAGNGNGAPRLAVLADGRMIATDNTVDDTFVRVFKGGDPYDLASWTPFRRFKRSSEPEVASGPRGTFLLEHRLPASQLRDDFAPFAIRSFNAKTNGWRARQTFGADALAVQGGSAMIEDAAGRLHVASPTQDLTTGTSCLLYTRTGPARKRHQRGFGRTTVLAKLRGAANVPTATRIAAGADGRGVAVWVSAGTAAAPGHVFATPLRQKRGSYRAIRLGRHRPYCPRG